MSSKLNNTLSWLMKMIIWFDNLKCSPVKVFHHDPLNVSMDSECRVVCPKQNLINLFVSDKNGTIFKANFILYTYWLYTSKSWLYSCDCIEKVLNILRWHMYFHKWSRGLLRDDKNRWIDCISNNGISVLTWYCQCTSAGWCPRSRRSGPAWAAARSPRAWPGVGRGRGPAPQLSWHQVTTPLYHHWALPPPVSSHQLIIQ